MINMPELNIFERLMASICFGLILGLSLAVVRHALVGRKAEKFDRNMNFFAKASLFILGIPFYVMVATFLSLLGGVGILSVLKSIPSDYQIEILKLIVNIYHVLSIIYTIYTLHGYRLGFKNVIHQFNLIMLGALIPIGTISANMTEFYITSGQGDTIRAVLALAGFGGSIVFFVGLIIWAALLSWYKSEKFQKFAQNFILEKPSTSADNHSDSSQSSNAEPEHAEKV